MDENMKWINDKLMDYYMYSHANAPPPNIPGSLTDPFYELPEQYIHEEEAVAYKGG